MFFGRPVANKTIRNGNAKRQNNGHEIVQERYRTENNYKNGTTTVHKPTHALEHLVKGFAFTEQAGISAKWILDASRRLLDQTQER